MECRSDIMVMHAVDRSAERKYVDVVVHMSAQEIFGEERDFALLGLSVSKDDDQTFVRIVQPSKRKTVHDRHVHVLIFSVQIVLQQRLNVNSLLSTNYVQNLTD